MNFKINFNAETKKILFQLGAIIFFMAVIDYYIQETYFYRAQELLHDYIADSRTKNDIQPKPIEVQSWTFDRLSPDGSQELMYYSERELDRQIISLRNTKAELEKTIYSGSRVNLPDWLGNEHIFFTTYCGTSCQGLDLVNVINTEVRTGLLSYMFFVPKRPVYTHFRSWFGEEFEFNGLPTEIISETNDNKTWLIFKMKDETGKFIGEKRFIFTGNDLKEL